MNNIYNIYSKFNDFLDFEDRPTTSQSVQQQLNNVGQKMKEYKDKIFTSHQRANSSATRNEQKHHTQKSKSPIWDRMNSQNSQKKKIFDDAPVVKRTKPQIFSKPEWKQTNLQLTKHVQSQPSEDLDESSLTVQFLMTEDKDIDEMYYKENNECEILSYLITQMGKRPTLEIQGTMIENLTRKNSEIKKQLSLKLMENQHQLNWCYYMWDALSFRVNQCCARIARARLVLKLLKQTHKDLGLKIQKKQKQKEELELQISNVIKFRQRYQQVFELVCELNKDQITNDSWSLYKIISIKDLVWTQSRDMKQQMHLYYCFSDIRGYIETLFQQQLEYSYRFFTQNIILTFVQNNRDKEELYKMLDSMCDYLQYYELNNKSIDISKQIRTSLQSQFRSIIRQQLRNENVDIQPLNFNKQLMKKGVKYDCLHSLNKYLTAFLTSFYLTSYSLGLIVQQFQRLLQINTQQKKQPLLKKIGFQYNIEKNQFWQYIQDKVVKSIRHTKMDAQCVYQDWIRFEALIFKIIQIGEELSNLKSYTLLFHLKNTLRLIAQGLSINVIQCLSIQKGMGSTDIVKPQYQCVLFNKLDIYVENRRLNIQSQYLNQLLEMKQILPHFEQQQPLQSIESPYNKKEEYYFIVSKFQELLFFAQNIQQFRIDCFLHTIHCFEYYCYLLIRNDLYPQIKQLQFELPSYEDNFDNLVISHHQITKFARFNNLQQMLMKQIDSIRSTNLQIQVIYTSSCLREILENLTLCFQIYEFIKQSYRYQEDIEFIESYLKKTKQWLDQLKFLWIFNQGLKDSEIDNKQITSYQIMYKMTQIMHQISVISLNNQTIRPEEIGQIYYQAYTENLMELIIGNLNKQNKQQILGELQKFIKQINGQYQSQQFDCFVRLLDIRTQSQYLEQINKLQLLSLKTQISILQKDINLDLKQITQIYINYVNENS
ncbi:unnamed protein product [Paramecium primaurelia]|uniref:Uncharacterized protein n=1 Tax=Paramecium primaurelia TaxID=5886 RepID=A0A8S1Q4U3_PARPR|nr:unnamed protein product [Paramecium primaurelia]